MQIGLINRRVILQSPGGTRDAVGERVTTWTDVATVWARIDPIGGREQFLAAQLRTSTTHKVTVRHSSVTATITAAWRINYGGRIFAIDSIRNVEESQVMIELLCTEGARKE